MQTGRCATAAPPSGRSSRRRRSSAGRREAAGDAPRRGGGPGAEADGRVLSRRARPCEPARDPRRSGDREPGVAAEPPTRLDAAPAGHGCPLGGRSRPVSPRPRGIAAIRRLEDKAAAAPRHVCTRPASRPRRRCDTSGDYPRRGRNTSAVDLHPRLLEAPRGGAAIWPRNIHVTPRRRRDLHSEYPRSTRGAAAIPHGISQCGARGGAAIRPRNIYSRLRAIAAIRRLEDQRDNGVFVTAAAAPRHVRARPASRPLRRRDSSEDYPRRGDAADNPRRCRGGAAIHRRTMCVAAAASPRSVRERSASWPGAAIRQETIRVAAAASPRRVRERSASRPRRCRDAAADDPRRGRAPADAARDEGALARAAGGLARGNALATSIMSNRSRR